MNATVMSDGTSVHDKKKTCTLGCQQMKLSLLACSNSRQLTFLLIESNLIFDIYLIKIAIMDHYNEC